MGFSDATIESKFFFQFVFCAVSLAIVWGTTLERVKFGVYVLYAIVFSALIYPIFSGWVFGGGWLQNNLGMQDFAGSTAVHLIGATGALAALLHLGPRKGKYGPDGKPRAIPGHNMPLFGLGIFILWLGWFGFNPGSTLGALDGRFPEVVLTTNIAAAGGVLTAVVTAYWKTKTIDIGMAGNGAIAALVAITAPSGYVVPWAALVIGLIAGVIVVARRLRHRQEDRRPGRRALGPRAGGHLGHAGVRVLHAPEAGAYNAVGDGGAVLHGLVPPARSSRPSAWSSSSRACSSRPTSSSDHQGDVRDARLRGGGAGRPGHLRARHVRVPGAVHPGSGARRLRCGPSGDRRRSRRRAHRNPDGGSRNMKMVVAYIRHEAFEPIRTELLDLGFPSLSISEVKGSGRQKGITERYRGAELTNYLRPKIKLECVVASGDVQTIVDTILKHARTGAVGDGKVFVMPIEEAYRVRTGEAGEEILQAHPDPATAA